MKLCSLVIVFVAWSLSACTDPSPAQSPPIEGQVLELGTGKPLPEAIVVGRWQESRSMLVDSQTVCVHVETAVTDAQGRFALPAWQGRTSALIDVFKPGYEIYYPAGVSVSSPYYLLPFSETKEARLAYLERVKTKADTGQLGYWPSYHDVRLDDYRGGRIHKDRLVTQTRGERLGYLETLTRASGCRSAGRSRRSLYPLYKTIFEEAKTLVETASDKETLQWIRRRAAYAATAEDRSLTQHEADQLAEQHLSEHLQ